MQYGNYVSVAHLHSVFNKVKRSSNVSEKALAKTFFYYQNNRYSKRLSPNFLAIADYTKFASQKRLFIINLHTGGVTKYLLAHGLNSGERGDRVWNAGNAVGSFKNLGSGDENKLLSKK